MTIKTLLISIKLIVLFIPGCLCLVLATGCQFSGGTALPEPSEVKISTPSGYEFYTNSKVKTSLHVTDGDKVIKFKMNSEPDEVIEAQAKLATNLVPLAALDAQREQMRWDAFKAGIDIAKSAFMPVQPLPGPIP